MHSTQQVLNSYSTYCMLTSYRLTGKQFMEEAPYMYHVSIMLHIVPLLFLPSSCSRPLTPTCYTLNLKTIRYTATAKRFPSLPTTLTPPSSTIPPSTSFPRLLYRAWIQQCGKTVQNLQYTPQTQKLSCEDVLHMLPPVFSAW